MGVTVMRRFLVVLLAAFLWSGGAWGATYYVDYTSGVDNTNSGTAADNAWKTIANLANWRTNRCLQSQTINSWTVEAGAAVTANAYNDPDGNATADNVSFVAGSTLRTQVNNVVDNTLISISFWAKQADSGGATYTRATTNNTALWNTGISGKFALTSSWQRFSVTGTVRTTTGVFYFKIGTKDVAGANDADCIGNIVLWGVQVEVGPTVTDYIPTTTVPVTVPFQPGDSILFKRGETWREQLTVVSSGTADTVITFGAYGAGTTRPIINGSDIITGWTDNGSNRWIAAVTTEPRQVFFDNTRGTNADNVADVDGANKWYWASNVLYVYSTSDADTAFTSPGIEASKRDNGIYALDKSYWNANSIDVEKTNLEGFYVKATGTGTIQGITWDNNISSYNARHGFYIENESTAFTDNIMVSNNVGNYNGWNGFHAVNVNTGANRITVDNCAFGYSGQLGDQYGVAVYSNIGTRQTRLTVKNCEVHHTNQLADEGQGIDFDNDTSGNIAEFNYVHDNEGTGIMSGLYGDNNIVRYNLVVNNGSGTPGYGIEGSGASPSTSIYNNTIHNASGGSGHYGIFLWTDGTYNVKNNIVSGPWEYSIVTNSAVAATCTNNLMYGFTGSATAGTASCTSSVTTNPSFVDNTSNWSLQAGSPAINAGVDVGLTTDYLGNAIVGLPDIGAYEYQSAAAVGWKGPPIIFLLR